MGVVTLDITVTDLFCGAGGSSIGAEAMGARLRMAANHWRLAIETHNANFPNADHDCADISQVDPRRYPRTDILIASPECTNHSSAKTRRVRSTIWDPRADAAEERSRATMWDVPRFAEHHRYELVVVENVVEARRWEPFEAWLAAMRALGYDHRAVFLNSMVAHPTPQSRDRMYVVFWRRGNRPPDLDFRPVAWCAACERDVEAIQAWKQPTRPFGKYRSQYVYRCPGCAGLALPYAWPAASAIDWDLPVPRIGDRDRPLAEATIRRIRAGLERFGGAAIVQAAGHTYERAGYYRTWPLWRPLGTQTTTIQHALVVETAYSGRSDAGRVRASSEPVATLTGQQSQALVVRNFGIRGGHPSRLSRPVSAPLGVLTTDDQTALVVPLRTHGTALAMDEPLRTVVAGNQGQAIVTFRGTSESAIASCVQPAEAPIRTVTGGIHHALLVDYHGQGKPMPVSVPHRTVDTRDRYALVEPAIDVDDCGFRMLEPHEIGRAMAFPDTYEVRGNKRDRVRQYGNAVTPPVMTMILARAIGSLA